MGQPDADGRVLGSEDRDLCDIENLRSDRRAAFRTRLKATVVSRTVDTHIAALRKKIEDDVEHPTFIVSIRNVGYRFNENLAVS